MPFTDHVTAVLALPTTLAEKLCDVPSETVATAGVTVTATVGAGDCRVTVAVAEAEEDAEDTALTATVLEAGRVAGAV